MCGDGGSIICCELCPVSCHPECIGLDPAEVPTMRQWYCPHHACLECGRKAAAVGGLLFRCSVCPKAFCEDHLPADALIMGENPRFLALGQRHPKQGCYVLHSSGCVQLAGELGVDCGEASASGGVPGVSPRWKAGALGTGCGRPASASCGASLCLAGTRGVLGPRRSARCAEPP